MKLKEICLIQSGGTPARTRTEYWNGGTIPWVKISDFTGKRLLQTEERITQKGLANSSAKVFPKGTLLYTIFATLGKVCILGIDAATNQAIAGLTITSSAVTPDYLYYFLSSLEKYVNSVGRGVAQNNINLTILRELDVPVPELSKQVKISNLLEKIDSLIETHKHELILLDALVKSRFVELFGDPELNPMGWKQGIIRDGVVEVRYGTSRPAVDNGRYPYLRMNNITAEGNLDLTDIKRIDIPDSEIDKCSVRRGDVLFNRTNSRELVGKTCVYDRDDLMILAGFIIRIRTNDLMLPEFLSAFLNTDHSKRVLRGMCKNAIGQANINAQEMQNIGIYFPPLKRQERYVAFMTQVNKSKFYHRRWLNHASNLLKKFTRG